MKRVTIEASFNPVVDTDFQRVADKIRAVLDTEGNSSNVVVRAEVTRPTEIEFRPGQGARRYWPGLREADGEV